MEVDEVIYELCGEENRRHWRVYSPQAKSNYREALGKDFLIEVCPPSIITDNTRYMLNLYHIAKTFSTLPDSGSILDQDNKTLDAFMVIEAEIGKMHEENMDKTKANRGGK